MCFTSLEILILGSLIAKTRGFDYILHAGPFKDSQTEKGWTLIHIFFFVSLTSKYCANMASFSWKTRRRLLAILNFKSNCADLPRLILLLQLTTGSTTLVWVRRRFWASEVRISCDAEYLVTLLYCVAEFILIIILDFYNIIAINVTSPKRHIHTAS